MDERQVRLLVQQAIARHMGTAPSVAAWSAHRPAPAAPVADRAHVSFARFDLVRPAGEIECLIEPTVTCTHCGHCQCYGH